MDISTRSSVEHHRRSPSPHLNVRRRGNSLGGTHYFQLDSPFDEKARSITNNRDKLLEMADLSLNTDKTQSYKNIGGRRIQVVRGHIGLSLATCVKCVGRHSLDLTT